MSNIKTTQPRQRQLGEHYDKNSSTKIPQSGKGKRETPKPVQKRKDCVSLETADEIYKSESTLSRPPTPHPLTAPKSEGTSNQPKDSKNNMKGTFQRRRKRRMKLTISFTFLKCLILGLLIFHGIYNPVRANIPLTSNSYLQDHFIYTPLFDRHIHQPYVHVPLKVDTSGVMTALNDFKAAKIQYRQLCEHYASVDQQSFSPSRGDNVLKFDHSTGLAIMATKIAPHMHESICQKYTATLPNLKDSHRISVVRDLMNLAHITELLAPIVFDPRTNEAHFPDGSIAYNTNKWYTKLCDTPWHGVLDEYYVDPERFTLYYKLKNNELALCARAEYDDKRFEEPGEYKTYYPICQFHTSIPITPINSFMNATCNNALAYMDILEKDLDNTILSTYDIPALPTPPQFLQDTKEFPRETHRLKRSTNDDIFHNLKPSPLKDFILSTDIKTTTNIKPRKKRFLGTIASAALKIIPFFGVIKEVIELNELRRRNTDSNSQEFKQIQQRIDILEAKLYTYEMNYQNLVKNHFNKNNDINYLRKYERKHKSYQPDLQYGVILADKIYNTYRDLKAANTNYINLFKAAKNSQNFPGVSPKFLTALASLYRTQFQIQLDENTEHVIANSVYSTNLEFTLLIMSIPILDDEHLARIYEVLPFPQTYNKRTLIPVPEHKYMAFYYSRQRYSLLTEQEVQACRIHNYCSSKLPIYNANQVATCGASQYFGEHAECIFNDLGENVEYYLQQGNITFYHAPIPVKVSVDCDLQALQRPGKETQVLLHNSGSVTFPPLCYGETDTGIQIISSNKYTPIWYDDSVSLDIENKEVQQTLLDIQEVKIGTPRFAIQQKRDNNILFIVIITTVTTIACLLLTILIYNFLAKRRQDLTSSIYVEPPPSLPSTSTHVNLYENLSYQTRTPTLAEAARRLNTLELVNTSLEHLIDDNPNITDSPTRQMTPTTRDEAISTNEVLQMVDKAEKQHKTKHIPPTKPIVWPKPPVKPRHPSRNT